MVMILMCKVCECCLYQPIYRSMFYVKFISKIHKILSKLQFGSYSIFKGTDCFSAMLLKFCADISTKKALFKDECYRTSLQLHRKYSHSIVFILEKVPFGPKYRYWRATPFRPHLAVFLCFLSTQVMHIDEIYTRSSWVLSL